MVVQLWIAEGLVHQPTSQKSWEKVGEEYFDELVSRSLIHRRYVEGKAKVNFEMHDLINDLATMVSSPCCIKLDEHKLDERVRQLSNNRAGYDSHNRFDKLYGLKGLRTFLALPLGEVQFWSKYSLSDKVEQDLLPSMNQLRLLSLSNYGTITKLPNSIGNLIFLRYLNLSFTGIKRLPSVTCNLYNLQTLLLSGCFHLTELPNDMGKLENLRHLDIRGTALEEMPIQIARLQNLQTLSTFVVSKHWDGLNVAQLGKFSCLQGKPFIVKLQNVTDPSDAFQANLKMKEQIDKLSLQWDLNGTTSTTQSSQIQSVVLEQLRPSTKLKRLMIGGYGGTNFPNWLGDSSFGNMVSLRIDYCGRCSSLPPLGQLHCLKELIIHWMVSVKSVGAEFYGSSCPSFPSLETLSFSTMPKWEEWNLIGGTTIEFPSLRHLSLYKCPKLKGNIPINLPSLTSLELKDCPKLKGNNITSSNLPCVTELELSGCPLLVESGDSDDNNINSLRPLLSPVFCTSQPNR